MSPVQYYIHTKSNKSCYGSRGEGAFDIASEGYSKFCKIQNPIIKYSALDEKIGNNKSNFTNILFKPPSFNLANFHPHHNNFNCFQTQRSRHDYLPTVYLYKNVIVYIHIILCETIKVRHVIVIVFHILVYYVTHMNVSIKG